MTLVTSLARRAAAARWVAPCATSVARGGVPSLLRPLSTQTKKTIQQGSDFNELRERSLLRHVINTATEGDAASVMTAMDTFWDTYFNGEGTAEWQLRGNALDSAIRTKQPKVAMEIGAYCGYTAVRMGRLMAPDSKLVSIEIDPLYAAIATKVRPPAPRRPLPAPRRRASRALSRSATPLPSSAVTRTHRARRWWNSPG